MQTFIDSEVIKTENGKLIKNLVEHINHKWPLKIPEAYISLIGDISKGSPVAGLLQVTSALPLKLLSQFISRKLNISDASQTENTNILHSSLPTIFPILVQICTLEKSDYLPETLTIIMKKLIYIRQNTFDKAPVRFTTDYPEYTKPKDDQTQFFPVHEIFRHLKNYKVFGQDDHCTKTFPTHKDFADGIFVIGCSCPLAITYGFEMMLGHDAG